MLLHGYLSSKESFALQINYLSSFRRVIAVDLPGFGKTPEPSYPYSLTDYVNEVDRVIVDTCGGRCDILAHSFGGRIALKLAATNGQRVNKMLLVGCAGMRPVRSLKYYIKRAAFKALKKISPRTAQKNISLFASPDYLALSPSMRESFKLIVGEHLDGILKDITTETLVVCGKDDRETPPYMARRINEGIKNSSLIFIEGGHFCFLDSSNQFNLICREFFK